jgi:hypothetical protein
VKESGIRMMDKTKRKEINGYDLAVGGQHCLFFL